MLPMEHLGSFFFLFGFHVIAVGAGISSPKVIGCFEMSINTAYTDIEICQILQLS